MFTCTYSKNRIIKQSDSRIQRMDASFSLLNLVLSGHESYPNDRMPNRMIMKE